MRRQFTTLSAMGLLGFGVLSFSLLAQERTATLLAQSSSAKLLPAIASFVDSLNDQQREQCLLPYTSEHRAQWHFVPMDTRKGLPLMQMQSEQKKVAMEVLQAVVSQIGYEKATGIMQLESLLKQLEGAGGRNERNPEKYYFTIFGDPGAEAHWGLSVEGHHLSLNFVIQGERIVDSTPQFMATNPAVLQETYSDRFPKGYAVLHDEEQLAFDLLHSLDEEQQKATMLAGETPSEIRAAGKVQAPRPLEA
ncbi:MAG: DUF3500 domain-containing protein, partial [Parachlamydiaceae bacterium]